MSREHIEWNDTYSLGVEDIDFQHHYFLDLVNRLSDVLGEDDNPAHQMALIAELNAYVRFHFLSEEGMMLRAGYPLLDVHKRLHAGLLEQLSVKEIEMELEPTEEKIRAFIDFLVHWFLHHTAIEDKQFSDYLHKTH